MKSGDGTAAPSSGLEGVVVADTQLSEVDGERGRLIVRGFDIEELAERASLEATAALLWGGALPAPEEEAHLARALGAARVAAFERLGRLGDALAAEDGMDAARAAVAHLESRESAEDPLRVTAAVAVYVAAWQRTQQRQPPVAPDPARGHAEDYLRMSRGAAPTAAQARALERYLVTVADHGMNASTFTARVVASTRSDMVSAVVAAIGALKGPLHGGAPGPVLDMLDAIGAPERALPWLEAELAAGRRIMGMGHRIYRVRDPRVAVLEMAIGALEAGGTRTPRLALARAVERAATDVLRARHPDRPLLANVEFATAVLLDAVGLPRQAFSPTFAVGRVIGWVAHVLEQRATGRLIRPASRYVGPLPG